ncbi:MAG: hypothetical protein FWD69_10150 [Polyangiaceae bacterium]|nr:hypothetical protein [Polyangiaceae bacterium]
MTDVATTNAQPQTAETESQADFKSAIERVFPEAAKKLKEGPNASNPASPSAGGEHAATAADAPAGEAAKTDDRVSVRILAARKADLRAAEARKKLNEERAQIEQERAQLRSDKEFAERAKAAKMSPSKLLELSGIEPKKFLEMLATEHDPSQLVATAREETKTETAALREELAVIRRELAAEKAEKQQAQTQYSIREAQRDFVMLVAGNVTKYPNIRKEFTPEEVAFYGLQLADKHRVAYKEEHGEDPDNDYVAGLLEEMAKQRSSRVDAWSKLAPMPGNGSNNAEKTLIQRPTDRADGPRTLTTTASGERASPPRKMTSAEKDEASLRILREAFHPT